MKATKRATELPRYPSGVLKSFDEVWREAIAAEIEGEALLPAQLPDGVVALRTGFELSCSAELPLDALDGGLRDPEVTLRVPGYLAEPGGAQLILSVPCGGKGRQSEGGDGVDGMSIHTHVRQLEAVAACVANVVARAKTLGLLDEPPATGPDAA